MHCKSALRLARNGSYRVNVPPGALHCCNSCLPALIVGVAPNGLQAGGIGARLLKVVSSSSNTLRECGLVALMGALVPCVIECAHGFCFSLSSNRAMKPVAHLSARAGSAVDITNGCLDYLVDVVSGPSTQSVSQSSWGVSPSCVAERQLVGQVLVRRCEVCVPDRSG
jgi:hypothetical protein